MGGRTVGTNRPLMQNQIWALRCLLDREGGLRDCAVDRAIDGKMRGRDLVKIKIAETETRAAHSHQKKRPSPEV